MCIINREKISEWDARMEDMTKDVCAKILHSALFS